jgi:hypothetical protein
MALTLLERLADLTLHKPVRTVHHAFRKIALPVEGFRARKALAERQPGKTEEDQDQEAFLTSVPLSPTRERGTETRD